MGDYTRDEPDLGFFKPRFTPNDDIESAPVDCIIKSLSLEPHIEGGYFKQTDTGTSQIPSPYPVTPLSQETVNIMGGYRPDYDPLIRLMSTTIFYFISPNRPQGHFHRNRSRIIHSLHRGRGRYVLINPDGRVETFIAGHDIANGERLQWTVESGVWKACFLLEDHEGGSDGMLITETVAPGFEYADHEFLSKKAARDLLTEDKFAELGWLVRNHHLSPDANGDDKKGVDNHVEREKDEGKEQANDNVFFRKNYTNGHQNGFPENVGGKIAGIGGIDEQVLQNGSNGVAHGV